MSARELKRIAQTYGFEVASGNTPRASRRAVLRVLEEPPCEPATLATPAPPEEPPCEPAPPATPAPKPPPSTPEAPKKKKKRNPYAGASGPFSRKAKWSKKRRPRLVFDDVAPSEMA